MKTIKEELILNGVRPNIQGYHYIIEAVEIASEILKNHKCVFKVIGNIYKTLAVKHETTESKIERSIRHAISIYSKKTKQHFKNGEFIFYFAEMKN